MHVHIYKNIHTYTRMYTQSYMHTHTHTYTCIYTHTYIYIVTTIRIKKYTCKQPKKYINIYGSFHGGFTVNIFFTFLLRK